MARVGGVPCHFWHFRSIHNLCPNEKAFTAAMGRIFKQRMMARLRSDTLAVVDLEAVSNSPRLPKENVQVEDLTMQGRECKRRATLEAERRYCNNSGNDLNGKPVHFTERDKLSALLDPRTLVALKKCEIEGTEKSDAMAALKAE
jgi:hypothetical protein